MSESSITLTDAQRATITTALIQAAISWADPSPVIEVLCIVFPEPLTQWAKIVEDGRAAAALAR